MYMNQALHISLTNFAPKKKKKLRIANKRNTSNPSISNRRQTRSRNPDWSRLSRWAKNATKTPSCTTQLGLHSDRTRPQTPATGSTTTAHADSSSGSHSTHSSELTKTHQVPLLVNPQRGYFDAKSWHWHSILIFQYPKSQNSKHMEFWKIEKKKKKERKK